MRDFLFWLTKHYPETLVEYLTETVKLEQANNDDDDDDDFGDNRQTVPELS